MTVSKKERLYEVNSEINITYNSIIGNNERVMLNLSVAINNVDQILSHLQFMSSELREENIEMYSHLDELKTERDLLMSELLGDKHDS